MSGRGKTREDPGLAGLTPYGAPEYCDFCQTIEMAEAVLDSSFEVY